MNRTEGGNNTENSNTNTWLNSALNAAATGMLGLIYTQPTPAPIFAELSDEKRADLIFSNPGIITHHTALFDKFHNHFLESELITPADLANLKKNYLNFIKQKLHNGANVAKYDDLAFHRQALEKVLIKHLRSKSPVRTQKATNLTEHSSKQTDIDTSLAYRWKTRDKKKVSPGALDKLGDAHGLIQATGWSTQNENSLLAVLDAWNYQRYKENIAEGRFILSSLIDPFYPLFTEYQDIAHREKNILFKILRTAIPMLITAGFIISIAALIPVALPELAFVFLAVPLLYLGLVAASLYVKTTEFFYQGYRYLMYQGDLEQFPEFQINNNLMEAFAGCTQDACDKAQKVRTYYIEALQNCDAIETQYKHQTRPSEAEDKARQANLDKSHELLLEWFDLHDNKHIYRDKATLIALKRLKTDERTLSKQFETTQEKDEAELKKLAHTITDHLREARDQQAPSLRFFPSCLNQRDKIIGLQRFEAEINPNPQNMNA